MKNLSFTSLIGTFLFALIKFTFVGGIGWLGIILIIFKLYNIIHLPWLIVALPLEYNFFYCLYMTFDGYKYKIGLKGASDYTLTTSGLSKEDAEFMQIQIIIREGDEHTGKTIERLCIVKERLNFNQALLNAALRHYSLTELLVLGNKNAKAQETLEKWQKSGLKIPKVSNSNF